MFKLLLTLATLMMTSWALYPSGSNVIELNVKNFHKLVINGDEIWIVNFFAQWCSCCQTLIPEYTKAATVLNGVIKVGAINANEERYLAEHYNVKRFPTIKIFGVNKNRPENYNGSRTALGLIEAAVQAIEARIEIRLFSFEDVVELTDSNFDIVVLQSKDMWMIEFFTPWCDSCKKLAPYWAKAGAMLKGKVKFGTVDAMVHKVTASKYGVKSFPTIKCFPPENKELDSVFDYDGAHTFSDIVEWSLEKLAKHLSAAELVQIIDQNTFKKTCLQKFLCFVVFLPHILDCQSLCRNNYINIMENLNRQYKTLEWGWVWSEALAQQMLEEAFGIGSFGYPVVAVVNTKKMKYSIVRGAFSDDEIYDFLQALRRGRVHTFYLKEEEFPEIVPVQPWDGKDAKLVQEETDLSGVKPDDKDAKLLQGEIDLSNVKPDNKDAKLLQEEIDLSGVKPDDKDAKLLQEEIDLSNVKPDDKDAKLLQEEIDLSNVKPDDKDEL